MRIRKEWSKEEDDKLRELYPEFGCEYCSNKFGRTSGSIRKRVIVLGLSFNKIPYKYRVEQFEPIVKLARSYSDLARKIGLSTGHGNRKTLINYIQKYNLDISHFDGGYEETKNKKRTRLGLDKILVEDSSYSSIQSLKKNLFKLGLKNKICEECGQNEEWRGKKMSLHLDHINGNNKDNRIDNLRILCPNCHATTDTYCNKNRSYVKNIPKRIASKTNKCPECDNEKYKRAARCTKCDHLKQRKVQRPEYELLIKEIDLLGYEAVGRKYGVSGSSIRKWIKSYKSEF